MTISSKQMHSEADLSVHGLLLDIDRFASHDGPGIRTAVFLKGCPLLCAWCHSPESRLNHVEILYQDQRCNGCWLCLKVCPEGALTKGIRDGCDAVVFDRSKCTGCGACVDVCYPGALKQAGRSVTVGALLADVERDRPFFESSGGGITLSGGEPARQFHFSHNFLLACQSHGIHTALETTGYARWEVISELAHAADLLLYDIKFVDTQLHRQYVGVSNELILENLKKLAQWHPHIQVRIPCITGVNDGVDQIRETAKRVAQMGLTHLVLLPYNGAAGAKYAWLGQPFVFSDIEQQSAKYMALLADVCREVGLVVAVGG